MELVQVPQVMDVALVVVTTAWTVLALLQDRTTLAPPQLRRWLPAYSLAAGSVVGLLGALAYPFGMWPCQMVIGLGVYGAVRWGVALTRRVYGKQATGEVNDGLRAAGGQAEAPGIVE